MKKYTYDAFISYSHNEKDAFAAEQLHKTLEHYHIPKRIQQSSGKKKIERVFRDREEMPISFNLASNIQEALDQSEFLILVFPQFDQIRVGSKRSGDIPEKS